MKDKGANTWTQNDKCLVVINVEKCKGLSLELIEFLVAGCIQ